ncbi:hypothetical protein CCP1ISM_60048 [Azospirillaceae bacterium]
MPLGKNIEYRYRTTSTGKKQRLAFNRKTGKVVEVKGTKNKRGYTKILN